ncbi:MAG: DUF6029 family protein [Myxococcota bacterium]
MPTLAAFALGLLPWAALPPQLVTASSTAAAASEPDDAAARLQAELAALSEVPPPSSEGGELFPGLQYEFVLQSTARWQVDNGESSEFFNTLTGAPQACMSNEECAGDSVCFEGTCRSLNRQYDPSGENFGDLVTTVGGTARWEAFVATARIDTAVYVSAPEAAPDASSFIADRLEERYENQIQAEYFSLAYSDKNVELTLGDYYVTLGRGLVLGVRIADSVGVDNKLRGAEGKFHVGPVDLHAFGGFLNIKNYEPGTGFAYEDTNDFIGGGRAELALGKIARIGAHAAYIQTPVIDLNQTEFLNIGATLELPRPVKWASFYAEVARIDRNRYIGLSRQLFEQNGIGIYSNLNLYFGPLTLLLEGKIYDNMVSILPGDATSALAQRRQNINRLSEPPTAERFGATILTNQTVFGGRLRADWAITPKIVPYVSYGHYNDGGCGLFGQAGEGSAGGAECDDTQSDGVDGIPPPTPKSFINAIFAGLRWRWSGGDLSAEAGYRGQFFFGDQTTSPSTLAQEESHATADVHQRFGDFNLELFLLGKTLTQIGNEWVEGRVAFTTGHDDGWSVTGAYEYTTISPNSREHYPSLSGQVQLAQGVLIRALIGGERPGLKCSGGACRFFPGFEGARLELNLRL